MIKEEEIPQLKSLLLVIALAAIFSFFTLWLIESWIKYFLFLFEIFVIFVLYLIINDYDIKVVVVKQTVVDNVNIGLIIDLSLIFSALSLLVFHTFHVDGGLVQLFLALLCTSLLSGHALLNIFELTHYFSKLENLVMSYILSYTFTGFITLIFLFLNQEARISVTLGSFVMVGMLSTFKHRKMTTSSTFGSFSKNSDFLALLVAIMFYLISFCFTYPGLALNIGLDSLWHYARSTVLGRSPEIYVGSTYVLAHLHEYMFLALSNSSLAYAQTSLVMLNLMLPLAFYIMVKPYLEKIDVKLPSLSTIFWVLFTNSYGGFAWLYFTYQKLSSIEKTQLQLLYTTADKTYNGTIYGILGLWYVPLTVSLVLIMVAIFLLCKKEIPTKKYLALFSIIIAILYLTHVTEAVVFALFLAFYGAISKNQEFRTEQALKSSIIGFILVIVIYYILSEVTIRFTFTVSLLISIFGPIFTQLLSLLIRKIVNQKLPSFRVRSRITNKIFLKVVVFLLLFVYVTALISWPSLTNSFHTWQVDTAGGSVGFVPWFMYPLILGINGLLAITALYYITKNSKPYEMLALFIAFMVFALIAGRIVSTINLYFFDAGYWEKRFILLIKLPLAAFAPIPILFLFDKLEKVKVHVNLRTVSSVIIIGTVVLYGISTTFLNLEYWNIASAYQPSSGEMKAVMTLKEILDSDLKAYLVSVTDPSAAIATFAAPADQLVLRPLLYTAYTPEMAFTQLYRHPAYDHAYIYLHNRDTIQLNKFADRFLANYIKVLPIVYENSEVKIFNVSKVSPPLPSSNTMLILPFDKSLIDEQTIHTVYSILSQGLYNYTVAYDLDDKALNSKTIVLSYDPPKGNILTSLFEEQFNGTLSPYTIIKGNWQLTSGKLFGGETGKYGEGIILSPVSAENFTGSFKVKPLSGDTSALNYVSLVYSWVDPKNYRYADIMFGADGYIYVHFRTIINGVEQAIPNWPGIKTDIKWNFGDEYNVTITVNGTINQIAVNGKTYLSIELENIPGRIGLRYYRFYQVSFDDFSLTYNVPLNLRPTEDYVNYLKSGGKLIVLNTNGYNYFGNTLLKPLGYTFNVEKIEGISTEISLPTHVSVPKFTTENPNLFILSRYTGLNDESPFIVKQSFGEGELFYVNIYPISEALRKNESPFIFYGIMDKLLEDLNLTKIDQNYILNFDGYVKAIHLNNNARAETTSLLFLLEATFPQLEIQTNSGHITAYNVTDIKIDNSSNLFIEAENFTIENGQGFYAVLRLNSTFAVKPSAEYIRLDIIAEGSELKIENVESFSVINNGPTYLLARTPEVSASEATFIEFYPSSSLQWSTRTYGQNLHVKGLTSLQVALSDSYTALKNVRLGSFCTRDPPIVMFDELSTIPTALFYSLLLLPIFLGVILIFTPKIFFTKQ